MITSADRGLALVEGFFRWWRAELAMLVPERVWRLSRRKGHVVLMYDGSAPITLAIETPNKFTVLGEIADPGGIDAAGEAQTILQRADLTRLLARNELVFCLRLAARSALCRTIELPLAAEHNLSEVVGYELDRYTPFRAEQVYFCHRVLSRDAATQRIMVEVTLVPRTTADEALTVVRGLGFAPERLDVADPASAAGHSDNLMAPTTSTGRRADKRLTYGLAAAAAVLATVAVTFPIVLAQRRAAAMTMEFDGLRKQTQAADALQKELKALRDDQKFLTERKIHSPTVSSLFLEATRLLPDDTWLTEFRVNGTEVEMVGVSASASALIGILEQSGIFTNTSFRSPVTSDPSSGRERFSIAAHIVEKRGS